MAELAEHWSDHTYNIVRSSGADAIRRIWVLEKVKRIINRMLPGLEDFSLGEQLDRQASEDRDT